jgi:hypothetical protein
MQNHHIKPVNIVDRANQKTQINVHVTTTATVGDAVVTLTRA